jgi:hypothetical protein
MGAHYVPRSSVRGLARQYYRYGYYRAKTANRHPASMRSSHLGPPAIILVCLAGLLGGRRSRALADLSLAAYALMQAAESLRATRDGDHREAPLLPIVYTTMHMSFGAGYIAGCLRFGIPLDALKLRLGR